MNSTAREQQRLLIVDDSKVVRVTARKILSDHFETVEAVDGENAWDLLVSEEPFSLVISDLSMPKLDGFELLARIRNSHLPHIRDLPVIIITGANDSEATKVRATSAGATDFIGKPFDAVHLLARTQAHASAHSATRTLRDAGLELEDEAAIDPLTRLANEVTFMESGYQQMAYAVRHHTRLSMFSIDIDLFGDLYKTHGANVAESIIQTVATVLTSTIRHEDIAARIGTARFALLLPGLNSNGIQNLANRIRKNISERVVKHGGKRTFFTISIGVAAPEIQRDTRFDDLLAIANSRLMHAVDSGGDRVVYEGGHCPAPQRPPVTVKAPANPPHDGRIPVHAREIEACPPTPECRTTDTHTTLPARESAGNVRPAPQPTVSAQLSLVPLHVPDLSLVEAAPESTAVIAQFRSHTDHEHIEITTAGNPHAPMRQETTSAFSSPGSLKNATVSKPPERTDKIHNQNISRRARAARPTRSGLLTRILKGLVSLFIKSR